MKTIYLCGPINGCSDSECKDWRSRANSALSGHYEVLDPMVRDYRGREDEAVHEIVETDRLDIMSSDYILALADRPSWGTAMEIAFAHTIWKRVIVVCGQERVSPWLRYHACLLFPTLDRALDYLLTIA